MKKARVGKRARVFVRTYVRIRTYVPMCACAYVVVSCLLRVQFRGVFIVWVGRVDTSTPLAHTHERTCLDEYVRE